MTSGLGDVARWPPGQRHDVGDRAAALGLDRASRRSAGSRSPASTSRIVPPRSSSSSGIAADRRAAPVGEADGVVGAHAEAVRRPVGEAGDVAGGAAAPLRAAAVLVAHLVVVDRRAVGLRCAPVERRPAESRICLPGTGHAGTSGTPRMSRAIRPSTWRSGLELAGDVAHHHPEHRPAVRPWRRCWIVTDEPDGADLHVEVGQLPGLDDGRHGVADARASGSGARSMVCDSPALQRGDPDRRQRRRRGADDADPDRARGRCRRRRPGGVPCLPGSVAAGGVDLDDAAVERPAR